MFAQSQLQFSTGTRPQHLDFLIFVFQLKLLFSHELHRLVKSAPFFCFVIVRLSHLFLASVPPALGAWWTGWGGGKLPHQPASPLLDTGGACRRGLAQIGGAGRRSWGRIGGGGRRSWGRVGGAGRRSLAQIGGACRRSLVQIGGAGRSSWGRIGGACRSSRH